MSCAAGDSNQWSSSVATVIEKNEAFQWRITSAGGVATAHWRRLMTPLPLKHPPWPRKYMGLFYESCSENIIWKARAYMSFRIFKWAVVFHYLAQSSAGSLGFTERYSYPIVKWVGCKPRPKYSTTNINHLGNFPKLNKGNIKLNKFMKIFSVWSIN